MTTLDAIYNAYCNKYTITIDSRNVTPGAIFFALKGDNTDGNLFVKEALAKGAAMAVASSPDFAATPNVVVVSDPLGCLQQLAQIHRAHQSIPVIGLTGSNGKTTTKELIAQVLRQKYRVFATQGNLNNHIGVPLSILSIKPDDEIAVIEMGANHQGEICDLCSIARPTHGLVTNVGLAHLEGFGSFEGVKKAKSELYTFLRQSGGVVFINGDDSDLIQMLGQWDYNKRVFYGRSAYNCKFGEDEPFITLSISPQSQAPISIATNLAGGYNISNILAAVSIGNFFGIPFDRIANAVSGYIPRNSRSQVMETASNRIMLDAYNANPTSMELAISSFASVRSVLPKMVILGEMLEMGEYADREHGRIADLVRSKHFDKAILVGKAYQPHANGVECFGSMSECILFLTKNPVHGRFILIKGSRGARMEVLLDVIK